MQLPFGFTKLTVDGCFKGNFGMTASGGNLCDHQGAVLAAFRSSLGCQTILYVSLWLFTRLELAVQFS